MKLSFEDDILVYIENRKEYTNKSLELLRLWVSYHYTKINFYILIKIKTN